MDIRLEAIQSTLIVKLDGEIDHHTAEEIREAVDREIRLRKIKNLIFDFDKVSFMDSSGVGVIIGRYKQIKAQGGKVLIIRAQPHVDRLLEVTGIKKIIDTTA